MGTSIFGLLFTFAVSYGLIYCVGAAYFYYATYCDARTELKRIAADQWFWDSK